MTRLQLLIILVSQARANGFEFRRWYTVRLGLPWTSPTEAILSLSEERRYYALLFSHEFATTFWKPGHRITFQVPAQTFTRKMADGRIGIVQRKSFMRRSARDNAWLYHLREMAAAEDPLRYMRRYIRVIDELEPEAEPPREPEPRPDPRPDPIHLHDANPPPPRPDQASLNL